MTTLMNHPCTPKTPGGGSSRNKVKRHSLRPQIFLQLELSAPQGKLVDPSTIPILHSVKKSISSKNNTADRPQQFITHIRVEHCHGLLPECDIREDYGEPGIVGSSSSYNEENKEECALPPPSAMDVSMLRSLPSVPKACTLSPSPTSVVQKVLGRHDHLLEPLPAVVQLPVKPSNDKLLDEMLQTSPSSSRSQSVSALDVSQTNLDLFSLVDVKEAKGRRKSSSKKSFRRTQSLLALNEPDVSESSPPEDRSWETPAPTAPAPSSKSRRSSSRRSMTNVEDISSKKNTRASPSSSQRRRFSVVGVIDVAETGSVAVDPAQQLRTPNRRRRKSAELITTTERESKSEEFTVGTTSSSSPSINPTKTAASPISRIRRGRRGSTATGSSSGSSKTVNDNIQEVKKILSLTEASPRSGRRRGSVATLEQKLEQRSLSIPILDGADLSSNTDGSPKSSSGKSPMGRRRKSSRALDQSLSG